MRALPEDDESSARLVLGPLLRFVDETSATLWIEADRACEVAIVAHGHHHRATTWAVHGHHYALVCIEGLPTAVATPYRVELDGTTVWPDPDSPRPPSVIRTNDPTSPFRLAFGSCRRSAPFDDEHVDALGADALVALARRMMAGEADWPDTLLMLGDQVYADDPSEAICERLREANRTRDPEVLEEIQDFEEYTWLYHEAWSEPDVRWLLSTVPTGMLLDDHDLRDDWNTSLSWRREVTSAAWWRERVTGALSSYWVYQHLGNLSPDQLAIDDVYRNVLAITDDAERSDYLDGVAWRADVDVASMRWSFCRDLGGAGRRVRLVAIDSRCSRHLDPDDRHMVDAQEWAWVRDQVLPTDGYDHLVLASTLPFLLVPGVHHLEGWDEAISQGSWGRPGKWVGERLRQAVDLEHWAAWRESFDDVTALLRDVVTAPDAPATVLMLGGDVHCSYVASATLDGVEHPGTAVAQLTMSPFRNDIERIAKVAFRLLARHRPASAVRGLAHLGKVDDVGISWDVDEGVWFDNGVMTIDLAARRASVVVEHAAADHTLTPTATVDLTP